MEQATWRKKSEKREGYAVITTKEWEFQLPGLDLVLEVVANVEDLVTDPEDDDQIPYWAEMWPAARGMAQYIWDEIDFQGETVLELGAGLGLPGMVAALKGGSVTFSDYIEDSLKIISSNAARNNIKDTDYLLADWRDFQVEKKFDWIIGSDVLYNPSLNPYVVEILKHNLASTGHLLFAHPSRPVTKELLESLITPLGLQEDRSKVLVTVQEPGVPEFYQEIDIHHLKKTADQNPLP
ncbi:MAG: methyltransferase domain-containing protein [Syntrophaceticus sp.]|nr:methyltransferase domain-containing protein [Syntrophaceticus sp.]